MSLFLLAIIAGALTVAAPCVLPLLPVIVGGSALGDKSASARWRPVRIAFGLVVSVVLFTLLLRATTALLGVPQEVWQVISALIVVLFGIHLVAPGLWEHLATHLKIQQSSQRALSSVDSRSAWGDVLLGAALGPVFNSCSPTYALIVAVILPADFSEGLVYLLGYSLGLSAMLLLIGYAGRSVVQRLGWAASPTGWFRRVIGALFILVGLSVGFGLDKKVQTYVLEQGWYEPIASIEKSLRGEE